MSRTVKYKIIASFLLMVFSLNTMAGFACSLGIDMGYNKKHHEHTADASQHGEKHLHKGIHHHKHTSHTSVKASEQNDDCCTNDVTSFAKLDKAVADNQFTLQTPVFLLAFASTFILPDRNEVGLASKSRFHFVRRSSFLNDTDIRIAIQSFQI